MLNYEFCIKLKELGFPQEPSMELPNSLEEFKSDFYYTFPIEGGCGGAVFLNQFELGEYLKKEGWMTVKVPQLEELIELTTLKELHRNVDYGEKGTSWSAKEYSQDNSIETESGSYLSALAELWLQQKAREKVSCKV